MERCLRAFLLASDLALFAWPRRISLPHKRVERRRLLLQKHRPLLLTEIPKKLFAFSQIICKPNLAILPPG